MFGRSHLTPPPNLVLSDVPYGDQRFGTALPGMTRRFSPRSREIAATVPAYALIALSARTREIDVGGIPVLERFLVGLRAVVLVRGADVLAN